MAAIASPGFSPSRRRLLRGLFLTGGSAVIAPLLAACGSSDPLAATGQAGVPAVDGPASAPGGELDIPPGPLSNIGPLGAPDLDGVAVPEGFAVRAVARAGQVPAIGSAYSWHIFPDGGATYPTPDGGWIYTSNSEAPEGAGGCGAIAFGPDGTIVDAYPILTNTSSNCAGGRTPWDTWLSCEETGDGRVWETDPYGVVGAVSKPSLGLFSHEAACVDPRSQVVYLTEDAGDGRFYRWLPAAGDIDGDGRMALERGRLQVMNIEGYEDGGYPEIGDIRTLRRVTWKDAVRPGEPQGTVRDALAAAGTVVPGTQIKGGEGLWFYEFPAQVATVPAGGSVPTRGIAFFSSKGDNRIYALDVENQLVEVIFDNAQIDPGFDDVDNVTVSPWGDILVAEDLVATGRPIRLLVVIPNQPAKVLVEVSQPGSEITGPAFSPDGSRLYFSSQRGPEVPGSPTGMPDGAPGSGLGATYELTIPPEFRGH